MEAKLILGAKPDPKDKGIKVVELDFGFTQYTDDTGKTTGDPTGGLLNLVVEPGEKDDSQLMDWMVSRDAKKDGKIVITDPGKKDKTIKFTNAECVQYNVSYSFEGSHSATTMVNFTMSAETMDIFGTPYNARRKSK